MTTSQHPGAPPPRVHTKLLDALVAEGLIAKEDHEAASLYARRRQLHIEEAIIQMGLLDEAALLKFQANYYKTQFVSSKNLSTAKISEQLLKFVPHKLAAKLCVFPVKYDARAQELSILMVEPDDLDQLKSVQFGTRLPKVRALVARPAAIQAAIRFYFEGQTAAFGQIRNAEAQTGMAVERDRMRALESQSLLPAAPAPAHEPVFEPQPGGLHLPPGARPPDKKRTLMRRTLDGGAVPPPPPPTPGNAYPAGPGPLPPGGVGAGGEQGGTFSGLKPPPLSGLRAPGLGGPGAQSFSALPTPTFTGLQTPTGFAPTGNMGTPSFTGLQAPMPMQPPTPMQAPMPMQPLAPEPGPAMADTASRLEVKRAAPGVAMHDYLETLNVLIALLENDRGDLRGHSVSVARVCRRVCERLGIKPEETDAIIVAAYLHDVGKTSAYHLTALNVAEYEAHRVQARKSYLTPARIFESVRLPGDVGRILNHLYERQDGQGFPDRLSGKEIPLGSRVLAIVETYADLTGHAGNPFRKKLSRQEAWDVLAKFRGKVFDSGLVEVFKLVVLGDDLRAKLLSDSRRALVVDSDAEETTVLELRLAEHGFQVTIARTATDAENELTQEFDVVISEVDLTPIDGFEFMQRVRAKGNEVPFVFLSKQSEGNMVQRGLDLGAEDFITKPASPEVVALKVNRVLDSARRAKRKAGVSGSLSEMALPDVVQILFHGRKSGKLSISAEGKRGEIMFSEGMIFDANFGDKAREEAFYAMVGLSKGDFELDPNVKPTEQFIQMSPESLLLEGMRRQDESHK